MWTCMCEHSCHKGLWVSINSQPEGSLLKGITLDVNYPWCPHISFHTFFLLNQMRQLHFQRLLTLLAVVPPGDMCFLSTNSLQLSFLDHAALIRQLIDCWRLTWNNESAVSVPSELLVTNPPFFKLSTIQKYSINLYFGVNRHPLVHTGSCLSFFPNSKASAALLLTSQKADGWMAVNFSALLYFK